MYTHYLKFVSLFNMWASEYSRSVVSSNDSPYKDMLRNKIHQNDQIIIQPSTSNHNTQQPKSSNGPLARYEKLLIAHAPGVPGMFSPPPRLSDPDMHHGTCVMHVPWCMPGSLTSGFLWGRWREKRYCHPRRMRKPTVVCIWQAADANDSRSVKMIVGIGFPEFPYP